MSLEQHSHAHTWIHDVLSIVMQALGMKLLRKKDVPDYKVPSLIWGWTMFARFRSDERNGMGVVFLFNFRLNIFDLVQYTIAMLGYADEDKTTVLELTYNYGRTEYSKGNAYAQVCMKSDGLCMVLHIIYIRSSC